MRSIQELIFIATVLAFVILPTNTSAKLTDRSEAYETLAQLTPAYQYVVVNPNFQEGWDAGPHGMVPTVIDIEEVYRDIADIVDKNNNPTGEYVLEVECIIGVEFLPSPRGVVVTYEEFNTPTNIWFMGQLRSLGDIIDSVSNTSCRFKK